MTADHVPRFYDDDYFCGGGDGYTDYISNRTALHARGTHYAKIVAKQGLSCGRMLDVGAAAGYLVQAFHESGWHGEGVEPNGRIADYGRNELGLTMHTAAFEDFRPPDDRQFELTAMVQVLSHFFDPMAAIRRAVELTRPGGHCLVETWDYRSLTATLAGQSWHQYSPPRVLFWFTRSLLDQMFEQVGCRRIATGRATKRISGRQAKTLAAHAQNGSWTGKVVAAVARLIPDRITVPYPGNDCFWSLYEKLDEA